MQPPPRKVKISQQLKTVHSEHISKLQAKHETECNLLEDIRTFGSKLSALEKDYGQALEKLVKQFQKREYPADDELKPPNHRSVYVVWAALIEQADTLAKARLATAEALRTGIVEPAKTLKSSKDLQLKKCTEQLNLLHQEVTLTVKEMNKLKKTYFEVEHVAHDAREKAKDAESKMKRNATSIFQSKATLQKNSAKLSARKDTCDSKSAAARNDYLMSLAAANAHQKRYFQTDLPEIIEDCDGDIYDNMKEFLVLLNKTQVELNTQAARSFRDVLSQAELISRQFNQQCFFHSNPVFSDNIHYDFDPCDNDRVSTLQESAMGEQSLDKEARKWANKIAREQKNIRDHQKSQRDLHNQMSTYKENPDSLAEFSPVEAEQKIEEAKQGARKAETSLAKAEARLEQLRAAGVNVDQWLSQTTSSLLSPPDGEGRLSRTSSRLSLNSEHSHGEDEKNLLSPNSLGGASPNPSSQGSNYDDWEETFDHSAAASSTSDWPGGSTTSADHSSSTTSAGNMEIGPVSPNDDVFLEGSQDRGDFGQQTGESTPVKVSMSSSKEDDAGFGDHTDEWDDTFDSTAVFNGADAVSSSASMQSRQYPITCTVLYPYEGQKSDELTIAEGDLVEAIDDGDIEGWVMGRNQRGEVGYVPENYLQWDTSSVDRRDSSDSPSHVTTSLSSSDVQYEQLETAQTVGSPQHVSGSYTSSMSSTDWEVQQALGTTETSPPFQQQGLSLVRALYDFDASNPEELTFPEGAVINVTSKDANGVDDGWWKGEYNGTVGVFPSLVVEDLDESEAAFYDKTPTTPNLPMPGVLPPSLPPGFLTNGNNSNSNGTLGPVPELNIESPQSPDNQFRPSSANFLGTGTSLDVDASQPSAHSAPGSPSGNRRPDEEETKEGEKNESKDGEEVRDGEEAKDGDESGSKGDEEAKGETKDGEGDKGDGEEPRCAPPPPSGQEAELSPTEARPAFDVNDVELEVSTV
ncbi:F-BAR and double SH3 domains protein 2-like isoform X3 [Branchiostoma floridae]|uniref:F-BAR and double SH3 domains protein 2-like isoform X3 n=1 Tax=Branchiostoma floridae TaxID=7739 RepID=A0A9J7MVX2_BRAFL|nr:F-BAR and double SH3 domains protein 2-like isoform X3 [Branchiostoma floridae]